jgi:hypothetical protein
MQGGSNCAERMLGLTVECPGLDCSSGGILRSQKLELERAFHESIDSYLELCAESGQQPDRP